MLPPHRTNDLAREFPPDHVRRSPSRGMRFPPATSQIAIRLAVKTNVLYFSTRMNSPVEALTATVNFALSRLLP